MEYPSTPADYKIVHLEGGDFTDANGNVWCNVLFEGYTSEPIKWVVKDLSKYHVGDVVHGHFETKMSKANKSYLRFYRDQQQQWGGAPQQAGQVAQGKYGQKDDHTQESIARSVALKAAVDLRVEGNNSVDLTLKTAEIFLAWLQGNSEISQTRTENTTKSYEVNPAKPWERITKKPEPEYQPDNFQFEGNEYPIEDMPPEYQ